MATEKQSPVALKEKKPRLTPEQKLQKLQEQQRALEEKIRKEKAAAKRRADEALQAQYGRIAKLASAAGLSRLDDETLAKEFAGIASRHPT